MNILIFRYVTIAFNVYYYLLIGYALMSWVPGLYHSPLGNFVRSLVEPILTPLRRFNLQIGGLDFTVLIAIFLLNVLRQLVYQLLFLFF